jgi:membrane protein implicated in regulation of membrane protease activity
MHIQHQNREHLQQIPMGQQCILFLGFVTFITGLICFGYALLAWFLLPFSSNTLIIACVGLIAAYLGRKALRRGRQEITL